MAPRPARPRQCQQSQQGDKNLEGGDHHRVGKRRCGWSRGGRLQAPVGHSLPAIDRAAPHPGAGRAAPLVGDSPRRAFPRSAFPRSAFPHSAFPHSAFPHSAFPHSAFPHSVVRFLSTERYDKCGSKQHARYQRGGLSHHYRSHAYYRSLECRAHKAVPARQTIGRVYDRVRRRLGDPAGDDVRFGNCRTVSPQPHEARIAEGRQKSRPHFCGAGFPACRRCDQRISPAPRKADRNVRPTSLQPAHRGRFSPCWVFTNSFRWPGLRTRYPGKPIWHVVAKRQHASARMIRRSNIAGRAST